MPDPEQHISTDVLVAGPAEGPVLVLEEPLSFWGGLDADTGLIIDHHHPQFGANVTGTVLVMRSGRGSSSASSVLTEAIRVGTSPAAIVLLDADTIIVIGAVVADELYGSTVAVVVVDEATFGRFERFTHAEITADGDLILSSARAGDPQPSRDPDLG